jgi:hypothetical protein
MNRWVSGRVPSAVQLVQKVQNPLRSEPFEPFEPCPVPRKIDAKVRTEPAAPASILSAVEAEPARALPMPVLAWRAGVARIRPAPAMGNLSAERWATFVHDCRSFVGSEWATRAATLAWDARRLFGCHRDRPEVLNWWGALWFIGGSQILAMTETMISLKPSAAFGNQFKDQANRGTTSSCRSGTCANRSSTLPRLDRTCPHPGRLPRQAAVAEVPLAAVHDDQRVALPTTRAAAARIPILEANHPVLPSQRVGRLEIFDLFPLPSAAAEPKPAGGNFPEDRRQGNARRLAHLLPVHCDVKRLPAHPSRCGQSRNRDAPRTIVSTAPQRVDDLSC